MKFWEDTQFCKYQYQIMVTLNGVFKGDTWEKWNILNLVYIEDLVIEVMKWVVKWL